VITTPIVATINTTINGTNTTLDTNSTSSNNSIYLFIDACPTKFSKLLNLTKSKIYLYVNFVQIPPSNRSNQSHPGNKSPSLYSIIIPHLTLNQSYMIKFDNQSATNQSATSRLAKILCGNLGETKIKNTTTNSDQNHTQSIDDETLEACCCHCTNWTVSPLRTQNCTNNFSDICTLPENKEKLSIICCKNDTVAILITTQFPTGIKEVISAHSNLALVFGILILILAVLIVCFVYRRRIRLFLNSRWRGSPADNESTSIRYGTLKHGDELSGW